MSKEKTVYICGPLVELPAEEQVRAKRLYAMIADLVSEVTGTRAFIPYEHYNPETNTELTPKDVDAARRKRIRENTFVLVVPAIAPTWGGGIEVEIANQAGVPVIVCCDRRKLEDQKISFLLRGNPAVRTVIPYGTEKGLLAILRKTLVDDFTMGKDAAA